METEYVVRLTTRPLPARHGTMPTRSCTAFLPCGAPARNRGVGGRHGCVCVRCRRLPRPAQKTLSELVLAIVGSRAPKLLITLTAVQLLVLIVGVAKEMGPLSENPSIGPSRERLRQMGALDITKIVEGSAAAASCFA